MILEQGIKYVCDSSRNVQGTLLGPDPLLWPFCEIWVPADIVISLVHTSNLNLY